MQIATTLNDRHRTLKTYEATVVGQCGEGGRASFEVGSWKFEDSLKLEANGFITTERDAYYTRVSLP